MTKVVPIIIANNMDEQLLEKHDAIKRLTNVVELKNRTIYSPAVILATLNAIPAIYGASTNKNEIDFSHIYGCDGFDVSLFALLAAAKIVDEKYPNTPILLLKATMTRDAQNDHTSDVKANISDAKLGHIITLASSDHMHTDAMFTYKGLHRVCSMIQSEAIDIEGHWPEYADARDNLRGKIAKGPFSLSEKDASDTIDFKLRTMSFTYATKKPELYSPWKTYDAVTSFSAR